MVIQALSVVYAHFRYGLTYLNKPTRAPNIFLKGEKRVIPDQNSRSNLVGIKINISPFMEVEMDRKSIQYSSKFNTKKEDYRIKIKYEFTKPGRGSGDNFGDISKILVSKTKPSYRESVAPRPKRSFNA